MDSRTISLREGNKYTRACIREEVKVEFGKINFTKRVTKYPELVNRMYNARGKFIGIDVQKENVSIEEVTYNKKRGTTKVAVYYNDRKFIGVARCNKNDFFDTTLGYNIAKARANILKQNAILEDLLEG